MLGPRTLVRMLSACMGLAYQEVRLRVLAGLIDWEHIYEKGMI